MRTVFAALLYFAITFAAGFAMGTLRTLFLVPAMGTLAATVLELPIMLAVSWWACAFVLRRIPVTKSITTRLFMGTLAWALLLVAEAGVSMFLGGLSLAEHLALYETAPVLLGLAAQSAFALFPMFRD